MDLAFYLYEYLPAGGRQRNCLAIAEACTARGAAVDLYVTRWRDARPPPPWLTVHRLPTRALTNVGNERQALQRLAAAWHGLRADVSVAFNRLPGSDLYYAGDPCFPWLYARRMWLRHLLPHYRWRYQWERAMARPEATTEILVLTETERDRFRQAYGTPAERLHVLPPNLPRGVFVPEQAAPRRAGTRAALGVTPHELLLLMVTSYFHTKGVDRAIAALAALPPPLRERTRLVVVGSGKPATFRRQAARGAVGDRVLFTGSREDMPALYAAADLLLHPARVENTGTVLLEALAMGLPVLTTAVCGYAPHVAAAGAGAVLPEPFDQARLDRALADALADDARRTAWAAAASACAGRTDFSGRAERSAELILVRAERNRRVRA